MKGTRNPEMNITTDEFDLCVVNRIVMDTHVQKKTFPAYNKLLPMISENITFLAGWRAQFKKNISQNLV